MVAVVVVFKETLPARPPLPLHNSEGERWLCLTWFGFFVCVCVLTRSGNLDVKISHFKIYCYLGELGFIVCFVINSAQGQSVK